MAVGFLGALICLGAALQVLDTYSYDKFYYDPATGLLVYAPNITFTETATCWENTIRINNLGFHARAFTPEKSQDVFRIVVIGSSFTESLQMPREKAFSALLEQQLNSGSDRAFTYEVLPMGFSGNGTYLNLLYYLRYGAGLKPDLVIDLTTEYELSRNAPNVKYPPRFDDQGQVILELPRVAQNPRTVWLKNIARKIKLVMILSNHYHLVQARVQAFLSHPAFFKIQPVDERAANNVPDADRVRAWEIEERLLKTVADQIKNDGAAFLLASWATPYTASSTADELRTRLAQIAATTSFPYLDLTSAVEAGERAEGKSATWTCDGHWNEDGHRWVAEAMFQYLTQHSELVRRAVQ